MIIHFGLHLDGMQPAPPVTAIGSVTLGPARFLDVLETQLGLPPVIVRPGEALLAYQHCLRECNEQTRFYHRSFEVDRLGVARPLLDWRTQWYEAGWQGSFAHPVAKRLADMAEVERLAKERVPLVNGQRLQRIDAALKDGLVTQIDHIVLHDDPDELPAAWQAVFAHFEVEVTRGARASAEGTTDTDLRTVQDTLHELAEEEEGAQRELQTLKGDDSLIIVRGVSRDLSAQALGEYLLETGALTDSVVIAERDGIIVDNALEGVGLARTGFQHYSRFRAATQVLKLALGLIWAPISPHLLLQFLSHSVGPLPRHARSTLAEAVASEPGVGGHAWEEAVGQIEQRMRERFGATEETIKELTDDIKVWLECDRYAPSEGAPTDIVIARTQRCATWLTSRLHGADAGSESDLFAAALGQSEALIAALAGLKSQGELSIGRIALEQLVDEVTGNAPDPGTFAQAGHVRATTEPATITQPWQTVIWWDLSPQTLQVGYPWSDAELIELVANGVALPTPDEQVRARTRAWLRPILNARAQLILVIHDREEGYHPLWNQLTSLFENFNELRIEDELLGDHGRSAIPVLGVNTEPLAGKPLAAQRRWWDLPKDCGLSPRSQESYSSLQKLIYYPHEWVLNYPARLRPGRASDLTSGNRLYGNLAHRLFESFFESHADWVNLDAAALRHWLSDYLLRLVTQEGAVLCEPGFGVIRQQVIATLENAFHRLLSHLKQADIETVKAEYWTEAPFQDIHIRGGIDLLLMSKAGREIVLDAKWGGQVYRGQELAENRHLQLATYAYLRKASGDADRWPYQAFFIISTGDILAQDTSIFPGAVAYPPETGEGVQALWKSMSETIYWRWDQLGTGQIEVNVAGTEPTDRSIPPESGMNTVVDPDNFDDFTWLTGWEDGA